MRFTTAILLLIGAGTIQAAAVPAPAAALAPTHPTLEDRRLHDAKPKPNPAKVEKEEDCDCNEDVFGAVENVVRDHAKQAPIGQAPKKGARPGAPKPKPEPSSSDKPSPEQNSHRLDPTHTQAPAKHVSEPTTLKPSMTVAPTPKGPVIDFTEWVTVKVTSTTTLQSGRGKRDVTAAAADPIATVDANSDNDDSPVANPSSLAWGDDPPDPDDNDNDDATADPAADPSTPPTSKAIIKRICPDCGALLEKFKKMWPSSPLPGTRKKRNWDDKIYTTDVAQFIKWKNLQPLGSNPGTSVKRSGSLLSRTRKRNWDDKIYTTDIAQFIKWKNLQPLGSNPGTSVKRADSVSDESETLKLSTIANLHRMDGYLQGSDACSSSEDPSTSPTKRGMLDGLSRLEAFFSGLHHKRDAEPGLTDGLTRLLNFFEGHHHKRQDPSSTASDKEEEPATEVPSEEDLATYKKQGYTAALADCPTPAQKKRTVDMEISRLATAYMVDGGFIEKRTASASSSPCKLDRAAHQYKCAWTGKFHGREGVRIFCTAPFPFRRGDEKEVVCGEVGKGKAS